MNWKEFNLRYEQRLNINNEWLKETNRTNMYANEFYKLFAITVYEAYDHFVHTYKNEFESINNNFVLDFEPCMIYPDNSGSACFSIESRKPTPFISKAVKDRIILVEAVAIQINWQVNKNNITFEIKGILHPYNWGGRNKLSYNSTGKNHYAGFDIILNEKVDIGNHSLLNRIKLNFEDFFEKAMRFYFLQSK